MISGQDGTGSLGLVRLAGADPNAASPATPAASSIRCGGDADHES